MRLFWLLAVLVGIAVLGCTDGKFNLLLVLWSEDDSESSSASFEAPSSSSIAIPLSSSSGEIIPPYSSSEEEPVPPSSSSRGPRSSSSINQVDFPPPLEEGAEGVYKGKLGGGTRYWDDCKPSCTRAEHVVKNGIWADHGLAKNCDRNDKEMPLYYRINPVNETFAHFTSTPDAYVEMNSDGQNWRSSVTYADWAATHPDFPRGAQSGAYVCASDQIPHAVNDTLAYAFAASTGNCGKCFQLQFRSDWVSADGSSGRVTHRAVAGKTLILMVNNFGVGADGDDPDGESFDIMIPGGGMGACQATPERLNVRPENLGNTMGGLLAECTFGDPNKSFSEIGGGFDKIEREPLERIQECLRAKCNRAFADHPAHKEGCLWHADWLMAADNPEFNYKEVTCPKYLVDRYSTTLPLPTRPADLDPNAKCSIGGILDCPAP